MVYFKRSSSNQAEVICEFDDELKGLRSMYALLHTNEGKNLAKFNNWNFTSTLYWDSVEEGFWFATNTTLLVMSDFYVIGV